MKPGQILGGKLEANHRQGMERIGFVEPAVIPDPEAVLDLLIQTHCGIALFPPFAHVSEPFHQQTKCKSPGVMGGFGENGVIGQRRAAEGLLRLQRRSTRFVPER